MKILKIIITFEILIICVFLLALFVKGQKGNPIYYQKEKDTRALGPYEGSNSTSRYAETEAIVLNKTFLLNTDLAKFSLPDLVYYKGRFFSIFTPGVSFLGIPFYIIGNYFKLPQLFTYFSTLLVALINVFLIARLSRRLGAGFFTGIIGGTVFLFATNALTYSLTFTQHHLSVTLIILSMLNAFGERTLLKNIAFGALAGMAILVDIPNVFLILPVAIYILCQHIQVEKLSAKFRLSVKLNVLTILIGLLPFLAVFAWYNHTTTGSFTKLGQTIGRTDFFQVSQTTAKSEVTKSNDNQPPTIGLHLTFATRDQLNGLYILLLSDERSWLYYSPIVLPGILGIFFAYKNAEKRKFVVLCIAIIAANIILYSMFADPWGGWAFGPRYLIPAVALMCVFLAVAVEKQKKNPFFILPFFLLLFYSLWINFSGALTTAEIPPKVEAINLPTHIPYTYQYNRQLIETNMSGSLIYNLFLAGKTSLSVYLYGILGFSEFFFIVLLICAVSEERRKK